MQNDEALKRNYKKAEMVANITGLIIGLIALLVGYSYESIFIGILTMIVLSVFTIVPNHWKKEAEKEFRDYYVNKMAVAKANGTAPVRPAPEPGFIDEVKEIIKSHKENV